MNGHEPELHIGVQKRDNQFSAHAWLVNGDEVVIGALRLEEYKLLTAWRNTTDRR